MNETRWYESINLERMNTCTETEKQLRTHQIKIQRETQRTGLNEAYFNPQTSKLNSHGSKT